MLTPSRPSVLLATFGLTVALVVVLPLVAYRAPKDAAPATLKAHRAWVAGLAWVDATSLASVGDDGQLHLWSPPGEKASRSVAFDGPLTAVAAHPESKRLAVGAWDKSFTLVDAQTGKRLQTLLGHTESITCVAFSPDGSLLASGSGDDTLRVWDLRTGKERWRAELDDDYDLTCLAFSADGKSIAGGDGEKRLTLWETATGKEERTFEGHEAALSCVAFAPDGKTLVTGSWDKTLRLWDRETGKELRTLTGHTESITCVGFHPQGHTLASGAEDGTVRVWEAATGKLLITHKHAARVTALAFRPDGRQLVTAGKEVLTFWPVEADAAFERTVQPFLKKHCVACHGVRKQEFGIRLDNLEGFSVAQIPLWTRVHEVLSAGSMPPEEKPRPDEAARREVLRWIEERQRTAVTGKVRRLNRRELSAALQDMTGSQVDFAYALPGDGKLGGFDTGIEALQDAADSVEASMKITRRAVDALRFREPAKPTPFDLDLRAAKDPRKALDAWKPLGVTFKSRMQNAPGQGLYLEPRWVGERDVHTFTFPLPRGPQGVLRMRLVVSALHPRPDLPTPRLWVEVSGRDLAFVEITGTPEKPQELIYEVQLEDLAVGNKGVKVGLSNRIEIPYAVPGYENEDLSKPEDKLPDGTGPFRPKYDRNKTAPKDAPAPFLILHHFQVDPQYVAAWPPAEWKADVDTLVDDTASAKKLLRLWMERAWRRPLRDGEMDRYVRLYEKLRDEKRGFDDALRATFQAVLLSGPFRYLSHEGDHALASRLSFTLWGTPPDATLRRLATEGKLTQPAVFDAQVDRLLADLRAEGFFRPFVTQWLELEQPITIASTSIKKQDFRFARYLKESMREETLGYVATLVRENRPAAELISSDWTLMNDSLALHYGYEGIHGGQLRKVKLRKDDPRGGGLLGHAGIQSMLTWMGGNWVIYRGAWTLRHLLDEPPPPPPLEVPELNAQEKKNHGKTFKQLLKQHQEDPNCTVCHRKMDPLGFAFQNFDLSGRWRDREYDGYHMGDLDGRIEWRGVGKARPVDTEGQLPRGEKFRTFAECKTLMVRHYQADLVRGLLKNVIIYSAGRLPNVQDLATIRAIQKEHEAKGYPLRDVIRALLRSELTGV